MFNAGRFSLARRRRGMTKKALAIAIGVSERSISAYEAGDQDPERVTLQRISEALGFPEAFFFGDEPEVVRAEVASFRSLSKMSARQRDTALGSGSIALMLNDWIEHRFNLPKVDLLDLGSERLGQAKEGASDEDVVYPENVGAGSPEAAAATLRSHWGLGELPIKNMIRLLESKGVRVYSLAIDAKEVDAFSMWHAGRPFMFLNTFKSAEHCRFDAAHELGHLVLHAQGTPQGPEIEREANAFASAFLMPKASVLAMAPRHVTLPALVKLKKYWAVSVAALNYRLHALGLSSDWIYRTMCIQLAEEGYRTNEPEGVPHERSLLLEKVFSALKNEGVSRRDVAKQLHLTAEELSTITFGLILNLVPGSGASNLRKTGKLTLVT
ncbi:ImmA/IrrE family metallo-endopeptidase [Dyella sp. GSA-30]|uniref:ImmA/IrrE family metallo-endopeptidase n=1 Tax=Dyella sp. GSA-30 TaxID=2994496 RepID=UPI002492C989|nr:ImmA/IrrE family metallo-endopeptidase [Dyella sp. GSA-30]BDU22218.1 transcriptional regulator [Dyella sp. GSA-30]